MAKSVNEVERVLTDEKLSAVKDFIEKPYAIECVFLMYLGKRKWKESKEFLRNLQIQIDDGSYRARMIGIDSLANQLLGYKNDHSAIDLKGYEGKEGQIIEKVAVHLLELFRKIDEDVKAMV